MKYSVIISVMTLCNLMSLNAEAPKGENIQGSAKIDPAMLEKLKKEGLNAPENGPALHLNAKLVPAEPIWSAPRVLDLANLDQLLESASIKKEPWLKDSYAVAMKTALYLSTGKLHGPMPEGQQVLSLLNQGNLDGEGNTVMANVQFIGRTQESMANKQFAIKLKANADGTWSVKEVKYSTLKFSGDQPGA